MFKKIKQAFSMNDLSSIRRNDEQIRPQGIARNIMTISNPYNVVSTTYRIPQAIGEPSRGMHTLGQPALATSLAPCSSVSADPALPPAANPLSFANQPNSSPTSTLVFTNLMESTNLQEAQQDSFFQMNIPNMLACASTLNNPPNCQEFKVILFNDAFRVRQIHLKHDLIDDIRTALLAGNCTSYQFLAGMAINLSQNTTATFMLRDKGIIKVEEFNNMNVRLHNYANELSRIGNTYYDYIRSKPHVDIGVYYLVARSALDNTCQNLYKACKTLDKNVKLLLNSHPETKGFINQNLNTLVNQFIYHYFRLDQQSQQGKPIQLTRYIYPDKLAQIQALFKDTSREGKGHPFDAGGTQHLYECYAEMFNQFIPRDQVGRQ